MPQDPPTTEAIELPDNILIMNNGMSFLLADNRAEGRILVFCSDKGRQAMAEYSSIFVDGTFKSCI